MDNASGKIWESKGDGLEINTDFANISYKLYGDTPYLYIQDMETNMLDGEWYDLGSNVVEPDMQLFVINRYTGVMVSASKWNCDLSETITKMQQ